MALRPTEGLRPCGGIELIGRYEGSGRQTDRYLAKRPDGAYVELTKLLYLVLVNLDGTRTSSDVAVLVGAEIDKTVSQENIDFLIDKLVPLGLIEDETVEIAGRPDMALGLKVKHAVVPKRLVGAITRVFQHLFHIPIVLAVIAGFGWVGYDIVKHGYLRTSADALLNKPQLSLVVLGLILFSLVFHELGHASACRYGGARPGAIGGGLYLAWPALYTDVSDAYRLNRSGRVRTDLGGIYFNAVLCVVFMAVYQLDPYPPLVLATITTFILMLEQLLPFFRFDGYWIVSDMAGVPDLFPRLSGAFRRQRHGRHAKQAPNTLGDLRPYSRRIIRTWAIGTVIVLPIELAFTLLLSATLFVSFALAVVDRYEAAVVAIGAGQPTAAALNIIQGALIVLLMAGLAYAITFLSFKIVRYAATHVGRGPVTHILAGALALAVLAAPVVWSATQVRLVHPS
jgi:putative peptide zinc metalloprotease protein